MKRIDPEIRFWRRVQVEMGGCWIFLGGRASGGYGVFYLAKGKPTPAHRFSYEQSIGPIPPGLELDHLCRTPDCVHPLHVEPVTHRENCKRGLHTGVLKHHANKRARTHCPKGHPFSGENLVIYEKNWRVCRTCRNEGQMRRYYLRKANAAKTHPTLSTE